jgi:hypothetical protein
MISERELQINPLVPDSIVHNTKVTLNRPRQAELLHIPGFLT